MAAAALVVTPGSASALSIPSVPPPPSLPAFSGHAFKGNPVHNTTKPPQNPFLAKNPNSNIHNDTWMTDAYDRAGPLGSNLQSMSEQKPPAVCGSIAFDTHGQLVSVCPSAIAAPQARIIDPDTLATVATLRTASGSRRRPTTSSSCARTPPARSARRSATTT